MKPYEEYFAKIVAADIERMTDSQFCGFLAMMLAANERNPVTDLSVRRLDAIGLKLEAIETIESAHQ